MSSPCVSRRRIVIRVVGAVLAAFVVMSLGFTMELFNDGLVGVVDHTNNGAAAAASSCFTRMLQHAASAIVSNGQPASADDDSVGGDTLRSLLPVPTFRRGTATSSPSAAIPSLIVQSHRFDRAPMTMHRMMETVVNVNPNFNHQFYSEESGREFIDRYFGSAAVASYDSLPRWSAKADFLRMCIIFIKGGVSVDSGLIAMKPLSSVLRTSVELLLVQNDAKSLVTTVFGATPKHPVIGTALALALQQGSSGEQMDVRKALNEALLLHGSNVTSSPTTMILQQSIVGMCGLPDIQTDARTVVFAMYVSTSFAAAASIQRPLPMKPISPNNANLPAVRCLQQQQQSSSELSPLVSPTFGKFFPQHRQQKKQQREMVPRNEDDDSSANNVAGAVMKIPRVIVQTHREEFVPSGMWGAMRSVIAANPQFDHEYYSDARAREFIALNCSVDTLRAFDALQHRSGGDADADDDSRAELFALCYISQRGGVFLAASAVAGVSLAEVLLPADDFVLVGKMGNSAMQQASSSSAHGGFIAAAPHHPRVAKMLIAAVNYTLSSSSTTREIGAFGVVQFASTATTMMISNDELSVGQGALGGTKMLTLIPDENCTGAVLDSGGSINSTRAVVFWLSYPTYHAEMMAIMESSKLGAAHQHGDSGSGALYQKHHLPLTASAMQQTSTQDEKEGFGPCMEKYNSNTIINSGNIVSQLGQRSPLARIASFWHHRSSNTSAPTAQRIPRLIIQTHMDHVVPVGIWSAVQRVRAMNTDYDHAFFSQSKSAREFIAWHFDPPVVAAFDMLLPGDLKADFLRYCALFHFGGVYIDADFIAFAPLDDVIDPHDDLVLLGGPESGLRNSFIATVPHHPVLGRAIELATQRIIARSERAEAGGNRYTGNQLFLDALRDHHGHSTGMDSLKVLAGKGLLRTLTYATDVLASGRCGNASSIGFVRNPKHEDKLIFRSSYPTYQRDVASFTDEWFNSPPQRILHPKSSQCHDDGDSLPDEAATILQLAPKEIPAVKSSSSDGGWSIPRRIAIVAPFNPIPIALFNAISVFRRSNANYSIDFFTDADARTLIDQQCNVFSALAQFDSSVRYEDRALVFCMCLLLSTGGVCLNANRVLTSSLSPASVIGMSDEFVLLSSSETRIEFVAAVVGSEVVRSVLAALSSKQDGRTTTIDSTIVKAAANFSSSTAVRILMKGSTECANDGGSTDAAASSLSKKSCQSGTAVYPASTIMVHQSPRRVTLDHWRVRIPFDSAAASTQLQNISRECVHGLLQHAVFFDVPHFSTQTVHSRRLKEKGDGSMMKIPRVIAQTHREEFVPSGMWGAMRSVIAANPQFDHEYYSDARAREFIALNCSVDTLRAFDALRPGSLKANLFRLCYLFAKGGVFIDVSVLPVSNVSFAQIINKDDEFVGVEVNGLIAPYMIAAIPNHHIVLHALKLAVKRIHRRAYGRTAEFIVGSQLLRDAFVDVLNKEPAPFMIFQDIASKDNPNLPLSSARLLRYVRPLRCAIGSIIADNVSMAPVLNVGYPHYEAEGKLYLPTRVNPVDAWFEREAYVDGGQEPIGPNAPQCRFGMSWSWEKAQTAADVTPVVVHMPAFVAARKPPRKALRIPRTILHTHKHDHLLRGLRWAIQRTIDLNPDFDHVYFSDAAAREFIEGAYDTRTLAAFDAVVPGAVKADLFRYLYLSIHGGVYADGDLVAMASLSDAFKPTDEFVSVEDNGFHTVWNALIATVPHHPIIEKAVQMAVDRISNRDYKSDVLAIAGPHMLGEAYREVVGESPQAHSSQARGVRLFAWKRDFNCMVGFLESSPGQRLFSSPFISYRPEVHVYTGTTKSYEDHWRQQQVFDPPTPEDFSMSAGAKMRARNNTSLMKKKSGNRLVMMNDDEDSDASSSSNADGDGASIVVQSNPEWESSHKKLASRRSLGRNLGH